MKSFLSLPEVLVEVAGSTLASKDLQTLASVRIQQRLSLPTLCELTFTDIPGSLARLAKLATGTDVRVLITGQLEPLFVGQITAIEHSYEPTHGHELRIRAYDVLHQLRKRQPVRVHVQVTAQDLAQELVTELGLEVQADAPGPLWTRLIQYRQSDLELLQEIAERCGLFLAVRGNTLHLFTLQGTGEVLPLTLGEELLEARIEINADAVCQSVEATGWDPSRIETHEGRAEQARVGRVVATDISAASVGGSGKRAFTDEVAPSDDHAVGIAQAELDLRVAREITLWGVAEGDSHLRPGTSVEISGVDASVAGRYVLTAVTHTVDAEKGFLSEISSDPPTPRVRTRGSVVAPGIVTQIEDPERLGRIRVSLPTFNNLETDWMGVLSASAGTGKGFMTLPDIGDQVLLLLAHEDPGQGVVIGSLYATHEPPDVGIDSGAVRRFTLLTPGGQRIRLDDGQQTVRVENSNGSYYELSPQKVRIHAAVDLDIEAPGRQITIRGKNIDFERG